MSATGDRRREGGQPAGHLLPAACLRCGALGPVELDHLTGRWRGVALHPTFTAPLCLRCHRLKGRRDRAAGVEGVPPTVRVALGRLAGWAAFLGSTDCPITLLTDVFVGMAGVLRDLGGQAGGPAADPAVARVLAGLAGVIGGLAQLAPGRSISLSAGSLGGLAAFLEGCARLLPADLEWTLR